MDMKQLLQEWTKLDYVQPKDIPGIELYMDQITTFMDDQLSGCKRNADDTILTKTMINNYSKNKLLPPSQKKKYSKEHIILLVYIYYLKSFLSITDIKNLLTPFIDMFYQNTEAELSFEDIYSELFHLEEKHFETIKKDIFRSLKKSQESFTEISDPEGKEFLQNLSLITTLSYDIYLRKRIIENMIDSLYTPEEDTKKKKKK